MDGDATWCHEVTLRAETLSPSRARAFVCQHLLEHNLPYLIDPVRLAASELATNVIVHAQTAFTVGLRQVARTVVLEVRNESLQLPLQASGHVTATRGRGRLQILDVICQDWGTRTVDTVGTTVWAAFAVRDRSRS
jgi:hypothetical protein